MIRLRSIHEDDARLRKVLLEAIHLHLHLVAAVTIQIGELDKQQVAGLGSLRWAVGPLLQRLASVCERLCAEVHHVFSDRMLAVRSGEEDQRGRLPGCPLVGNQDHDLGHTWRDRLHDARHLPLTIDVISPQCLQKAVHLVHARRVCREVLRIHRRKRIRCLRRGSLRGRGCAVLRYRRVRRRNRLCRHRCASQNAYSGDHHLSHLCQN